MDSGPEHARADDEAGWVSGSDSGAAQLGSGRRPRRQRPQQRPSLSGSKRVRERDDDSAAQSKHWKTMSCGGGKYKLMIKEDLQTPAPWGGQGSQT